MDTPHQVRAAVAAARPAFPGWRGTEPGSRGAALRAAAANLRADRERIADLHMRDTGRLLGDARSAVDVAASLLEEAATAAPLDAGRSLGGDARSLDVVRREPRGVVAVITPWNDPLPAAAGLLGAALATGNTVVHKPSERSSLVGAALAEALARHLPDGVLTVVLGDGAVGELLVADPDVDVVAHVGSSRAGRRIAEVAGSRAAKLLLENGGKDALVVDADVDPMWAAQQAALGAFVNAGSCASPSSGCSCTGTSPRRSWPRSSTRRHAGALAPRQTRGHGWGRSSTSAPWSRCRPTCGPRWTPARGC